MENTERDQPSIDGDTFPSSDDESEESTDTELPTSIDTAQPEAGKFSLTKPANEKVVQTELNGQTSNETSQTEQGTKIPVKENSTLTKGEDIRLSIQDYLDPGRTYSNRSAIKIPGDDTKKSKFKADYYRMRPSGSIAQSLCSDRALARARSLRSDRTGRLLGRYVATELWLELGRYVATEPWLKLTGTDVRSLRNDLF
ncbi:hypothetical protein F2Q68_00033433 [Brassica cretica]|nr:hypothetical protein F2Q68_00033433 [Brassica cretica]